MGAEEIRLFTITDEWALIAGGHGFFMNNGDVNLYIHQKSGTTPTTADAGVRIRPGGSFFVSHDIHKITYLRTISGTTTIAKYEDKNNGAGSVALVDAATGNSAAINELGQVHTVMRAQVDADNSTITPLVADEEFVGEWKETLDYAEISITSYSDVASAVDGLCIEFSSDGVGLDGCGDNYTLSAGAEKTFSFQPQRRYYRVKYTNGAVDQTVFDLETILHKTRCKPSSHRINDSIVDEDDAELVKAVITGMRDNQMFTNARFDNTDRLKVVAQEYTYSVAEGVVPNHYALFKFGTRTAVAAGTQSTVWEGATALYPYLANAEQLKIASSSANDTAAGTGARTLTILGLDANFDEITETIDMAGLAVVTTVNSYKRIFRAFVATCGTLYANAGNITVTNNAGTVQQLYIPVGDGQTLMTTWTVPKGRKLYLTQITKSTDSNKGARVSLFTRYNDGGILYPWRIRYRDYIFSGNDVVRLNIPLDIPEKTDVEIRVTTPASSGTTSMGATFEGWYETT